MFILYASCAALAFAFGTFFTKGVTLRISIFRAIGPLFLLNGLLAIPFIGSGPTWKVITGPVPYLHLIAALASGVVAYVLFSMVAKSTASVSSVAPAMAPAVVLLLSPVFLSTDITLTQIFLVLFLMAITLYPLRNSISGLNSSKTIAFMIIAALGNGAVTIIAKLLANEDVGMPETFIVRQLIAGLAFTILFPPIGLKFRDFYELVRRSFFMAIGWMTSITAIQKGSPLIVQTFLATIPITVILIETVAYRKRPDRAVVISAVLTACGIAALTLTV
ncbi:MAG: EamA family transporter [Actinomycetota bacterium]